MLQGQRFALLATVVVVLVLALSSAAQAAGGGGNLWVSAGHDLANTRNQNTETKISPATVANLAPAWQFTTGGDVSATPAVDGQNVYFPDWAGNLFAVNQATGQVVWQQTIASYTGIPNDRARTTPAIIGNLLIFGDQGGYVGGKAWVMAVNRLTGALIWKTNVEPSLPFPIVTQSAVVDTVNGRTVAFVGVASAEEAFEAFIPGYPCCSFRGSLLALDVATGQILWKTYTVPQGYSGASVWGSTPAIDKARGTVYVGTGNNYSVPASVQSCVAAAGNNTAAIQACISPDDHFDSVLALDEATGAIKWATRAIPADAFNLSCVPDLLPGIGNPGSCPPPAGPDYDFGQGPILFSVMGANGAPRALVGDGQKSGQYWALDRDTGQVVWMTQVGPGGVGGGMEWGSAYDGTRIYVADANTDRKPWTLNGQTYTSGFWAALDPATGAVLWQQPATGTNVDGKPATAPAAVTVANGVVFGCSMDTSGPGMQYAFNAATGAILWARASGGSCNAGPAVSGGMVYWGTGYSNFGQGAPSKTFTAFGLP